MPNPDNYDLGSRHERQRLTVNVNRLCCNERKDWFRKWRYELRTTRNGRVVLKGINP